MFFYGKNKNKKIKNLSYIVLYCLFFFLFIVDVDKLWKKFFIII